MVAPTRGPKAELPELLWLVAAAHWLRTLDRHVGFVASEATADPQTRASQALCRVERCHPGDTSSISISCSIYLFLIPDLCSYSTRRVTRIIDHTIRLDMESEDSSRII